MDTIQSNLVLWPANHSQTGTHEATQGAGYGGEQLHGSDTVAPSPQQGPGAVAHNPSLSKRSAARPCQGSASWRWAMLLACALAPFVAGRTAEQAEELMGCLSEGHRFQATDWNTSVLEDALPNLALHQLWWSGQAPRFDLTIITQLSVDRSAALFNQCTTYLGPMSAAVYLPLVQPPQQGTSQLSKANSERLKAEARKLQALHDMAEAAPGCQLDLMLFYEVFVDQASALLYPVNALRNFARMQVRTQLLSAIDVDMMISRSLSDSLLEPGVMRALDTLALSKVATVLPAFEPSRQGVFGRAVADQLATGTKDDVARLWRRKRVHQFKLKVFPRGHTPTNYTRWLDAHEPYAVRYERMYEPWFVTHWDVMPWFDVNFKGYGLNKIVHVASLNYYGFTFQVHPSAWLIHRPHEDTAVRKVVTRQASDVNKLGVTLPRHSLYNKVTSLFAAAKRAMILGDYQPALDPRMVRCMQRLTWLQPMRHLPSKPVDSLMFT